MAYNAIKNGMKGTPHSLEQRATMNKMDFFKQSPLEQAMVNETNFQPIKTPRAIFEPPVRPMMNTVGQVMDKQRPDKSIFSPEEKQKMELEEQYNQKMQNQPLKKEINMSPIKNEIASPISAAQPMQPPIQPMQSPIQPMQATTQPMSPIMQTPEAVQSDVLTAPKGNIMSPPQASPPASLQQTSVPTPMAQPVQSNVMNVPQAPPIGGGGLAPPPKPLVGSGVTPPPEIQHGVTPPAIPSIPAAQPSTPAQQTWQDNTVGASTSSFQNPYTNISGEMASGVDYLKEEGINVTDEYAKYFQDYDPTREKAAIQQYGLGQDATMAAARSNLMQMTQQGLGSGFGGVGFGGAGASGVRSQFGLGAQQAGLSLRGDIYGMRRQQEDDWWNTLASVEQRRGEMFGLGNISGTASNQTPDTLAGSGFAGGANWDNPLLTNVPFGNTGTQGSAGTGGGYGNNTTTQPAWWQTIPTGA